MAITTMDGLVAGLSAAPVLPINKASATAKSVGSFHSLWTVAGFPAAGSAQGSVNGAIPTSSTLGAIPFTNPGGANTAYLAKLSLAGATAGTFTIYDRLWHNSGLSGTATTAQTFTQPALIRHDDGIGVQAFLEIYTATGSTAVTATISYTNTDNTAGRSGTAAVVASPVSGQMFPFQLVAGDKGIKSIQSVTLSATTGTVGNFGLTLMKRKAEIPVPIANIAQTMDGIALGLPVIGPDACLALMVQTSATNTGYIMGTSMIIEG